MKRAVCLAAGLILASATQCLAQDAAKVSPGTTKVIFENAYIRVIRSTFKPGETEDWADKRGYDLNE